MTVAQIRTLRRGLRGDDLVGDVQAFLAGQDLYSGKIDDDFGPGTEAGVMAFQDRSRLRPTGVVDGPTWGALMAAGLRVLEADDEPEDRSSPAWPRRPDGMRILTPAEREERFGRIEYEAAPTDSNPEAIKITNDFAERNIVVATVPQLDAVGYAPGKRGVPGDERFHCHRFVRDPLERLFATWEAAGLLKHVLTWGGCWAPRFVRGSRKTLSNHAYGTAIDLNVQWNLLGNEPAIVGRRGCVRELVPIAAEQGWMWGGWFKRAYGMHFEYVGVQP